jgi:uncharacterized oligopeptide transporter (OPT) family protein
MASAGGSVGFTVAIVASIYYNYAEHGVLWDPPLLELSLFILALSLMGVAIAAPLRRFVVEWFFPSGVACATILRAATSENKKDRLRARNIMGTCGLLSALLTLPTKVAWRAGKEALWSRVVLPAGLGLSLDPLLYGIGIVIGIRIGASMLLGGLFNSLILSPQLQSAGENVEDYTRWIAVGLMTLPAFTSMLFAFLFKSHGTLPPGFHPKKPEEEEGLGRNARIILILIFLGSLALAIFSMKNLFGVSWGYVVAGAGIAGPLCVALGKVASETDINPVRLLAIILLFFFSLFGMHNPAALLAIGVCGAAMASIAVDLFVDLRTGHLIRANPSQQIAVQFLGVILTSFASVFFLRLLASNFGFGQGKYFPAQGAIIWSTMAEAFSQGAAAVSPKVWLAAGIASLLGIVLTLFENLKLTRSYAPSSFALGIALLLPFEMSASIFLGALIRVAAAAIAKKYGERMKHQVEEDAFQAGSAIFAASALAGIIAIILISLGLLHIPE